MQTQSQLAGVYTDMAGVSRLKQEASTESDAAKREVAQQFESIYTQMMIKAMRDATPKDGLLGSSQMDQYMEMHDQQLAVSLSESGSIGIAQLVYKQLGGTEEFQTQSGPPTASTYTPRVSFASHLWGGGGVAAQAAYRAQTSNNFAQSSNADTWDSPESFINRLMPAAKKAAAELGTEPEAILAVAALETGWGSHLAKTSNGQPSFNLFGIKADASWKADKVYASTLEFENGAMRRKNEPFRSYSSPDESIADFARFIQDNPRYHKALKNGADPAAFLQELHKAGYATDPNYSRKVTGVMKQIQASAQDFGRNADKFS